MPPRTLLVQRGNPVKRRVICACGCKQRVTTETQKNHLKEKHARAARNLDRLRSNIRRHSSLEAIRIHRSRSLAQSDLPPPLHAPSRVPSFMAAGPSQPPIPVPQININALWTQVMQARHNPELHAISSTNDSIPADFVSAPDSEADAQPVDEDLVGTFDLATYGLAPSAFIEENLRVQAAKNARDRLTPENLGDIQTFDFIIRHRLGVRTYYAVQQEFVRRDLPNRTLPSLKRLRTEMLGLSGLKTVDYHCCKESCVLYTGYLANLTECPHCGLDRYNAAGAPQAVFTYVPLIPQLRALYCNPKTNKTLHYRANYKKDNELIEDIFDSQHYRRLCDTFVTIDGVRQPYKFFSDSRELALGLSVDGMCPFKRRKNSCWPLIIINYNLPPEVRTLLENIICVGVVPGPHSPRDLNSFLQPLVEELVELAKGVKAVDVLREAVFSLRAHLIDAFGDIPALTKILEFLGHNARFPCRFCEIMAIPGRTAKGGSHLYCPLYRPDDDPIDPLNLPLRTHEDTLRQGAEVLQITNSTAAADKAKESGVKGVTLLARLPSITIPTSFPVEIMHMVWINLIPQLADLWIGKFNDYNDGDEEYGLAPQLWEVLGDICEGSGSTIPSSFGRRVPNLKKRSNFIAESWCLWATQLAPHVLRGRFRKHAYYVHFVRLVNLMNECMDYSMNREDLGRIREGFARWVQDYERIYYQYDPTRLQACTVNVHYLLHIADSIEQMGPIWCYWAYPMERYCSFVGASVKSRRFPWSNIARRIRDTAMIRVIREIYNLHDCIKFGKTTASDKAENDKYDAGYSVEGYPTISLLTPHSQDLQVDDRLKIKIAKHLSTVFRVSNEIAKAAVPRSLKQWGRVKMTNGGDLIHARGYHKLRPDERDASFVRYELLVDRLAHRPRAWPEMYQKSHYGQLQHIFQLSLPPNSPMNRQPEARNLLLALILEAKATRETTHEYNVTWYKGNLSAGEVVDGNTIQCAVGRVWDTDRWWIIDRSSALAYPLLVWGQDDHE